MARRGTAKTAMELEPVQHSINDGFEEDNIYENLQETVNPCQQHPCTGQEVSSEQHNNLQVGSNRPNQQKTYQVFDGDQQDYEPEFYEPLEVSKKQGDGNDDVSDEEDYNDVYLTVIEDNNLPPLPPTTGRPPTTGIPPTTGRPTSGNGDYSFSKPEDPGGEEQDFYDDIVTSNAPGSEGEDLYDDIVTVKAPKERGKIKLGKNNIVVNSDETDYKEKVRDLWESVSRKSFGCYSLATLFILLIVVFVLVILIIQGVISIKGINTCGCAAEIKEMKEQIKALQASLTVATTKATTTKTSFTTLNSTIAPTQLCPPGWRYFQNSCYYMVSAYMNSSIAKKSCIALQSTLVSIETKAENDFVRNTYLQCYPASPVSKSWLGLTYQGNISTQYPTQYYKWDSGQSINSSSSFFVNPNGLFMYTCFVVYSNGLWYSSSCRRKYAAICEGPTNKVSSCYIP